MRALHYGAPLPLAKSLFILSCSTSLNMVRASIKTDSHAWTFASFSRKVRLRAASASSAGGAGDEASAGDGDKVSGALTPACKASANIAKTAAAIWSEVAPGFGTKGLSGGGGC